MDKKKNLTNEQIKNFKNELEEANEYDELLKEKWLNWDYDKEKKEIKKESKEIKKRK